MWTLQICVGRVSASFHVCFSLWSKQKKKKLHFSLEGNCFFLISLIKTTCNLAECQTGWYRRCKTKHDVEPSESDGFQPSRRIFDWDRSSNKYFSLLTVWSSMTYTNPSQVASQWLCYKTKRNHMTVTKCALKQVQITHILNIQTIWTQDY